MTAYTRTERYQRCQRIFDRAYPHFRNAGQRYADHIAALPAEGVLLDIGCGRGSLAHDAIQRARFSVGIDLVTNDLRHNQTVDVAALANADQLPFKTASFDALTSQWVVEHFEHPRQAFAEMSRVLRPDGRLIFMTTNAQHYIPLISRLMHSRAQKFILETLLRRPRHESFPTFYRANTGHAIAELAAASGLVVEKLEYVANPFYLAFSVPAFRLAMLYEKVTDWAPLQRFKLYVVATLRKVT